MFKGLCYSFMIFFLKNNRFLLNFLYDKNMMLWNEKPNKNETLPGSIDFYEMNDFTYLDFFTIFIDFFDGMK